MLRYLATAVLVLILLGLALRSKGPSAPPLAVLPPGVPPIVRVENGPEGRVVTVRHAIRGSVTRAALVYEFAGEDREAAVETDCQRGSGATVTDDGYATVLELTGTLPDGATRLRLVLESETGTEVDPLEP